MRSAFSDLPADVRFKFLDALTAAGGDWSMYHGDFVQVCVPRVDWTPCTDASLASRSIRQTADGLRLVDMIATACGLERVDDGFFFPLGSDKARPMLRHDGPAYCGFGRYGYWFHVSYRPIASVPCTADLGRQTIACPNVATGPDGACDECRDELIDAENNAIEGAR